MPRSIDGMLALLGASLVLATGGVLLVADRHSEGGKTATAAPVGGSPATRARVEIKAFKYMPADVAVKAGSKVTFVNNDTAAHTATSKTAGAFDTDRIKKGQSKSVTLRKPGEFDYICAYHPFMKARMRVLD